jgi:ribosomal-protein-alanine N-acetyltransferase
MTVDDAFNRFPALTTSRLQLRQLQATDVEALFAMKSRSEVTTAYGQEPHQSLDDTHAWMQRLQAFYERREAIFWCVVLKEEDTVIGSCTLWNFDTGFHCAEIGYELNPVYGQRGVMTEAALAILNHAFMEFGLHRIEALTMAKNEPSKRLLLKLGFTCEGNLRQRLFFRDSFEDQLYFGLLIDDWLKSGNAVN